MYRNPVIKEGDSPSSKKNERLLEVIDRVEMQESAQLSEIVQKLEMQDVTHKLESHELKKEESALRTQLYAQLTCLEVTSDSLRHELAEEGLERYALQERISDQTTEFESMSDHRAELQQTVDSLRMELVEAQEIAEKANGMFREESNEVRTQSQECAAMKTLQADARDRVAELQQTNDELRKQLMSQDSTLQALHLEQAHYKEMVEHHEEELSVHENLVKCHSSQLQSEGHTRCVSQQTSPKEIPTLLRNTVEPMSSKERGVSQNAVEPLYIDVRRVISELMSSEEHGASTSSEVSVVAMMQQEIETLRKTLAKKSVCAATTKPDNMTDVEQQLVVEQRQLEAEPKLQQGTMIDAKRVQVERIQMASKWELEVLELCAELVALKRQCLADESDIDGLKEAAEQTASRSWSASPLPQRQHAALAEQAGALPTSREAGDARGCTGQTMDTLRSKACAQPERSMTSLDNARSITCNPSIVPKRTSQPFFTPSSPKTSGMNSTRLQLRQPGVISPQVSPLASTCTARVAVSPQASARTGRLAISPQASARTGREAISPEASARTGRVTISPQACARTGRQQDGSSPERACYRIPEALCRSTSAPPLDTLYSPTLLGRTSDSRVVLRKLHSTSPQRSLRDASPDAPERFAHSLASSHQTIPLPNEESRHVFLRHSSGLSCLPLVQSANVSGVVLPTPCSVQRATTQPALPSTISMPLGYSRDRSISSERSVASAQSCYMLQHATAQPVPPQSISLTGGSSAVSNEKIVASAQGNSVLPLQSRFTRVFCNMSPQTSVRDVSLSRETPMETSSQSLTPHSARGSDVNETTKICASYVNRLRRDCVTAQRPRSGR